MSALEKAKDMQPLIERLAFEQALYKKIAEDVSTKSPDNLRAQVDYYYEDLLNETGAKSFAVSINDTTVGTYSFRTSKAKTETVLEVSSEAELLAWAIQYGFVVPDMKRIQEAFMQTGEVPNGCRVRVNEYPETVTGGALKVDVDQVARVVSDLPGAIVGLLGDGNE